MQSDFHPRAPYLAEAPRSNRPSSWSVDPIHSSVHFTIRHMMIATVQGAFSKFTASLELDRTTMRNSTVTATIEASSIDTRDLKRDEHLRSAEFFDVAAFPTLSFKSRSFVPDGLYDDRIVGDLTIHGVTHEVTFVVRSSLDEVRDPQGNTRIGMSATTEINRKDFGLGTKSSLQSGSVLVGDEVSITLNLQFIKRVEL